MSSVGMDFYRNVSIEINNLVLKSLEEMGIQSEREQTEALVETLCFMLAYYVAKNPASPVEDTLFELINLFKEEYER